MKNFIKGFRFTPSNYPAEVEAKIQKYRKQGYKLPPRKVLRTPRATGRYPGKCQDQYCTAGLYFREYPGRHVHRRN